MFVVYARGDASAQSGNDARPSTELHANRPSTRQRVFPIGNVQAKTPSISTMTPRTRTSNRDANFKVYYSKKVPQQVHFPHKRKTVRRPSDPAQYGTDKQQMRFLPEKMRLRRDSADSGKDKDEDTQEGTINEDVSGRKPINRRGQKRHSNVVGSDSNDEDKHVKPMPKRRRKSPAPKSSRCPREIKAESGEEDNTMPTSTEQVLDRTRTIRRQSTMTQLVEGRRPMSDTEEPVFKPVKRNSRLSWSGQDKKMKDNKQRTLTQMIPGVKPLEIVSDDDIEEDFSDAEAKEKDSQAYDDAIAARLAQEGLMQNRSDGVEVASSEDQASGDMQLQRNSRGGDEASLDIDSLDAPSLVVHSVEDDQDESGEESYQPTQFIDAPFTRTRIPRRTSAMMRQVPQAAEVPSSTMSRTGKYRFGLLSTPEKRRIREIPSSQSPPDSPLSTQVSPSKAHRSPLQQRSGNNTQAVKTPSKRKQVKFQDPIKVPVPPPSLRKFKSVIQDSEDEEDDLLEPDENDDGHRIGIHSQELIQGMNNVAYDKAVGAETQAVLYQIDQACADADKENIGRSRECSEGLETSKSSRGCNELSPELGEQPQQQTDDFEESLSGVYWPYRAAETDVKQELSPELGEQTQRQENNQENVSPNIYSSHRRSQLGVKQEQLDEVEMLDLSESDFSLVGEVPSIEDVEPASTTIELPEVSEHVPSSPPIIQQPTEDTCPSTPMVIMDSSDEEEEPDPTPPHQSTPPVLQPSSTALQQSADLDGELVQVPRSPATQHETQQSHSSKAELQLQSEWFSYSQYVNARPPQSSSMNVAHDKFSYDATPLPPRPVAPPVPVGYEMSQATTVDEVTPRKNKTQRTVSANTTPRKIASSQPLSSPSKPPPLFIPSSFPSPAKAHMEEWSSPIFGQTQDMYGAGASLEDFSIPLPPPVEDDWMDGV